MKNLVWHVVSCLVALGSAIATAMAGVLAQCGLLTSDDPPILLLALSVSLFAVATYQGLCIHGQIVQTQRPR